MDARFWAHCCFPHGELQRAGEGIEGEVVLDRLWEREKTETKWGRAGCEEEGYDGVQYRERGGGICQNLNKGIY